MVRTQIQLTEQQTLRLRQLAHQRAQSIAELIRQSIDRFLQSEDHAQNNLNAKWERAILEPGLFRSGLPDLARNHDKYLVEAYSNGLYMESYDQSTENEQGEG